ncbi:lysophospholipid acyltransferase family protein [Streptomyces sp. NPDC054784]
MISRIADTLVSAAAGRLTVTADAGAEVVPGSIVVANHTSYVDPAVVFAALHRLGVRPVVMAAAELWRVPVLGRALAREGHIPVHRGDARAADALERAAEALGRGRVVLVYPEGGLPTRTDVAEAAPRAFRSGVARLSQRSGAPVVPMGQAGARRVASGRVPKQLAGVCTAPLRRPALHVHVGMPLALPGDCAAATERARQALTAAWRTAAARLG